MKRSTTIVVSCAFIGASLSAALAQTPGPEPAQSLSPAPAPSLLASVATDSSQPVRTRAGQTFAIALRSNRTTGFSWQLAEPPGAVVQTIGSAYEERSPLIGGGGQEIWLFQAVAAGTATITLRYVRPFEKGSAVMERASSFRIDIAP